MRILLAEDEPFVREGLVALLESEGVLFTTEGKVDLSRYLWQPETKGNE